jgi:hypothetical protein
MLEMRIYICTFVVPATEMCTMQIYAAVYFVHGITWCSPDIEICKLHIVHEYLYH